jgi:hypothetical protein
MGNLIWSIVAAIGGFGVIGVIFYYWIAGGSDRLRDDDARRFYDEHGRWPDEAA